MPHGSSSRSVAPLRRSYPPGALVEGKLQTRKWRKPDEDSDRFSTEILLAPGGRVQFLDRPNGNGVPQEADAQAMPGAAVVAANGGGAPADLDDSLPF